MIALGPFSAKLLAIPETRVPHKCPYAALEMLSGGRCDLARLSTRLRS
jgi:hypothetical protein